MNSKIKLILILGINVLTIISLYYLYYQISVWNWKLQFGFLTIIERGEVFNKITLYSITQILMFLFVLTLDFYYIRKLAIKYFIYPNEYDSRYIDPEYSFNK